MTVSSTVTTAGIGTPALKSITQNQFFADMELDIEEVFLDREGFGEQLRVNYHFALDDKWVLVNAIFDTEYYGADVNLPIEVESSTPVIICQTSKFIHPTSENDQVIVRGKLYDVQLHQPDGTGVSMVFLNLP